MRKSGKRISQTQSPNHLLHQILRPCPPPPLSPTHTHLWIHVTLLSHPWMASHYSSFNCLCLAITQSWQVKYALLARRLSAASHRLLCQSCGVSMLCTCIMQSKWLHFSGSTMPSGPVLYAGWHRMVPSLPLVMGPAVTWRMC